MCLICCSDNGIFSKWQQDKWRTYLRRYHHHYYCCSQMFIIISSVVVKQNVNRWHCETTWSDHTPTVCLKTRMLLLLFRYLLYRSVHECHYYQLVWFCIIPSTTSLHWRIVTILVHFISTQSIIQIAIITEDSSLYHRHQYIRYCIHTNESSIIIILVLLFPSLIRLNQIDASSSSCECQLHRAYFLLLLITNRTELMLFLSSFSSSRHQFQVRFGCRLRGTLCHHHLRGWLLRYYIKRLIIVTCLFCRTIAPDAFCCHRPVPLLFLPAPR